MSQSSDKPFSRMLTKREVEEIRARAELRTGRDSDDEVLVLCSMLERAMPSVCSEAAVHAAHMQAYGLSPCQCRACELWRAYDK